VKLDLDGIGAVHLGDCPAHIFTAALHLDNLSHGENGRRKGRVALHAIVVKTANTTAGFSNKSSEDVSRRPTALLWLRGKHGGLKPFVGLIQGSKKGLPQLQEPPSPDNLRGWRRIIMSEEMIFRLIALWSSAT